MLVVILFDFYLFLFFPRAFASRSDHPLPLVQKSKPDGKETSRETLQSTDDRNWIKVDTVVAHSKKHKPSFDQKYSTIIQRIDTFGSASKRLFVSELLLSGSGYNCN